MFKSLFFTFLTAFTSTAFAASSFDVMLSCNGCSDYKMKDIAKSAAFLPGQTIYVVDNRNGKFYVKEYYVNSVNPDSMDTPDTSKVSIANEWLRELTTHVPGSRISDVLENTDAKVTAITNDITRPFTINSSSHTSAFTSVDNGDFADWFTDYHYSKNLQNFNLLDAQLANAASSISVGVGYSILSVGTSFNSTSALEFSYSDGTKVRIKFDVVSVFTTGKYILEFKAPKFFDKKGKSIPKTKPGLTDYINNSSNLEENGNNESIKEHIDFVFEGKVQYIGFGEGHYSEGSTAILDCRIENHGGMEVVACYPAS